jgi:hypothetical protein
MIRKVRLLIVNRKSTRRQTAKGASMDYVGANSHYMIDRKEINEKGGGTPWELVQLLKLR